MASNAMAPFSESRVIRTESPDTSRLPGTYFREHGVSRFPSKGPLGRSLLADYPGPAGKQRPSFEDCQRANIARVSIVFECAVAAQV